MAGIVGIVGHRRGSTNDLLADAWHALGIDARVLRPRDAVALLGPDDVALGRLDVRESLDGVEPGLDELEQLEAEGVCVLNPAAVLVAAHDKLETAAILDAAGLPHPRTVHLADAAQDVPLEPPLVLKPRHGSWGRDVLACRSARELERTLEALASRPWFRAHGALLQELVPPCGWDLRLVVARGRVVAAAERVARRGEWRTNVALGGSLRRAEPDDEAQALAEAAAAAIGADLVGVDLLPTGDGYVVLELNGAVDFDGRYSLAAGDAYGDAARALDLPGTAFTDHIPFLGKEAPMRTYEFWREREHGSLWAVALREGVVVGCCGPLTRSEIEERFLPTFDYSAERGAVVETSRDRYELFDVVEATRQPSGAAG
jgi:[lysine-biosynthesis-protein LysW]--L-2-aminoadipate ligase